MSTLYLIRGLPGAGKSTLAKALNVQHIEADMYHIVDGVYRFAPEKIKAAHEWCQANAAMMLRQGDVAVSNTFTRRWELAPYYAMGAEYVTEITVDNGFTDEELAARTIHAVPVETIKAMRERWEA